eukprot:3704027-Rhodomonas_salina.1
MVEPSSSTYLLTSRPSRNFSGAIMGPPFPSVQCMGRKFSVAHIRYDFPSGNLLCVIAIRIR